MLPAEGCRMSAPKWPLGTASKDEASLWARLWALPVASYWWQVTVEPTIVARYVRLALERPEHASVAKLESELGLTPAAMLRLRLLVETPEPEPELVADPYAHLVAEFEA